MADEIENQFEEKPELIKGRDGVFEVELDGELLYSKKAEGRFPEPGEVEAAFKRSHQGWKDESFQDQLSKKDLTVTELKRELRELLMIHRYFRDHIFSRVAVTRYDGGRNGGVGAYAQRLEPSG